MPPLPVIADVYRCALKWTNTAGGNAANVMHFHNAAGSEAGLAIAWEAHVTASMWDQVASTARVSELDITKLDGSTATLTHTVAAATKWNGAGAGAGVPAVAAVLKLTTAVRGRSARGRVFLPFIAEGEMDAGVLDGTDRATAETAWQTFQTAMAGDGYVLGVASYKLAQFFASNPVTLETRVGTQRRRNSRLR